MQQTKWQAFALLTGRRIPTYQGDLATCVRSFLALPEQLQAIARITIPDGLETIHHGGSRTLQGATLARLAGTLPPLRPKLT